MIENYYKNGKNVKKTWKKKYIKNKSLAIFNNFLNLIAEDSTSQKSVQKTYVWDFRKYHLLS